MFLFIETFKSLIARLSSKCLKLLLTVGLDVAWKRLFCLQYPSAYYISALNRKSYFLPQNTLFPLSLQWEKKNNSIPDQWKCLIFLSRDLW